MYLKPIRFIDKNQNSSLFVTTLRSRVDQYFIENNLSKKYNRAMVVKTLIMLGAYIIPFIYYTIYNPPFYISLILWTIMAFGMAGIGMCIMHDANHGAYSTNYNVNKWLGYTINLAGAFAFNWKIQHNVLHHTYTNITHYDDDIDDKTILKLSPHTKAKWYHRYQHIYAFVFYAIATLYWFIAKDFIQYQRYINEGLNKNTESENRLVFFKLIVSKLVYLFVILLLPTWFFDVPISKTVACFVYMHLLSSLILTTIFQLAHTIEGTAHPLPNQDLIIEKDWAIHQMYTTANFCQRNRLITWFVGGLNYQIEHHLFPNICHVHYPQIAYIVKNTANEFSVPYLEFKTFKDVFSAHIKALKKFSI